MMGNNHMDSRALKALIMTAVVCLSAVAAAGVVSADNGLKVTVSDVAVSDDEPTTGDTITVTPTVRHSSSSDGSFKITQVTLSGDSGSLAKVSDLGTIAGGESIDVPLRTSFDSAGDKELTVTVRGVQTDSDGVTRSIDSVEYPVYISVSEPSSSSPPEPRLQIDAQSAVAGTDTPVTVTVSNGEEDPLTDLSLDLEATNQNLDTETRLKPVLGTENITQFEFDIQPERTGTIDLKATLETSDAAVNTSKSIDVDALRTDVRVDATVIEENDSKFLQYRLINLGNAAVNDVTTVGTDDVGPAPAAAFGTVDAAHSQTVTVPTTLDADTTLSLHTEYQVGGESYDSSQSVQVSSSSMSVAPATAQPNQSAQQFSLTPGSITSLSGSVAALLVLGSLGGLGVIAFRRFRDGE
ncbi:hypothetical protein PNP59_13230 [Halobacterium salinarum]|uniref:hypothetical protein n=1 Tax=Halobacterium salinarum TaxID=2242 RepID=UPI002557BCE7|nr:hypothetical protein [Halobacterium salinarum]MDL0131876.1 hypothetical protein [Halobacterium salinarum]